MDARATTSASDDDSQTDDCDGGAADEFAALEKFAAIGAWLPKEIDLPIWWSEWYTELHGADWSPQHKVALRVAAMIQLASTGAAPSSTGTRARPGRGLCDLPMNQHLDGRRRSASCLFSPTSTLRLVVSTESPSAEGGLGRWRNRARIPRHS